MIIIFVRMNKILRSKKKKKKQKNKLTSNGLLNAVTEISINLVSGSTIMQSAFKASSIAPKIPLLADE
jgi:hypothetical protein